MGIGVTVLAVCLAGAAAGAQGIGVTPRQAIQDALAERVGPSAIVDVLDVETDVSPAAGLVAQPEPSARFGRRARFVLSVDGRRKGLAVATVKVRMSVLRAARAIARDEAIGAAAVDFTEMTLPDLQIRSVFPSSDVVGLTARRDIARGEVLTAAVVRMPRVVTSGDEVAATLRVGAVVVTTMGFASGSGQVGDMIRVSQPHSSRLLRGRITGPGAVEIVE